MTESLGPAPGFERSPEHQITIRPADSRWQAWAEDTLLADSRSALVLAEKGYDEVVYFPQGDVRSELLAPLDVHTTCPFKGEASYFALAGDDKLERIAWTYPETYEEVAAIAGHIAFYTTLLRVSRADGD